MSLLLTYTPWLAPPQVLIPAAPVEVPAPPLPASPKTLADLAKQAALGIDQTLLDGLVKNYASTAQLPPTVVRPRIGRAGKAFGRLDQKQLKALRNAFVGAMRARLPSK